MTPLNTTPLPPSTLGQPIDKLGENMAIPKTNGISRRDLISGLAGALTFGATACSRTVSGPAPTLTSSYIPIMDSVPIIVAYAKGFFSQAGIKAEKPVLIRTWPALLEAFTSKQTLLTHILLPQVIVMRYGQNVPLRSVGFNHTDVVAMLLSKATRTVKDLGGKSVGCPTWWAPHTGIFEDVVRSEGLKPVAGKEESTLRPDEVLFRVIAPPDMVEGLKSERIAGCTVSEPFGAAGEVLAGATLIKMSGDVWRDHPCCQSVMLEETLNRDKAWSQAVTTAIYQAALWSHNNREELAQLLAKEGGGYFPMPASVIRRSLLKQDLPTYGPSGTGAIMHTDWDVYRVKFVPYPYRSAIDSTVELMKRMVVDPSTPFPAALSNVSNQQIEDTIIDYDLANTAIAAVGGLSAFGVKGPNPPQRSEEYQVLLKPSEAKK